MYGKEVLFPVEMIKYHDLNEDTLTGKVSGASAENECPKIVIHFSSQMCIACNIDKITSWIQLEKDFSGVKFVYVISFRPKEKDEIMEMLQNFEINSTIYLDEGDIFSKKNSYIVDNPIFHIFGINKNNRIDIVGDPLYNDKLMNLYRKWYEKRADRITNLP